MVEGRSEADRKIRRVEAGSWLIAQSNFQGEGGSASGGPPDVLFMTDPRGRSSAGRAPALQAGGRRFESGRLHQSQPGSHARPGTLLGS